MFVPTSSTPDKQARLTAALHQVAAGDRAALESVYRETSGKLFAVCRRILIDGHDAEEALQETYLTIWRRAASYDGARGSPNTWLVAVARHCAIDRLRQLRRAPASPIELAAEIADDRSSAFDIASAGHEERRLHDCLGELGPGDRAFITTAFYEGESYATLATRQSLPLGTVKSRIRRALLKLRACLE